MPKKPRLKTVHVRDSSGHYIVEEEVRSVTISMTDTQMMPIQNIADFFGVPLSSAIRIACNLAAPVMVEMMSRSYDITTKMAAQMAACYDVIDFNEPSRIKMAIRDLEGLIQYHNRMQNPELVKLVEEYEAAKRMAGIPSGVYATTTTPIKITKPKTNKGSTVDPSEPDFFEKMELVEPTDNIQEPEKIPEELPIDDDVLNLFN